MPSSGFIASPCPYYSVYYIIVRLIVLDSVTTDNWTITWDVSISDYIAMRMCPNTLQISGHVFE